MNFVVINRGAGFIQVLEDNTKFYLILSRIKNKTIGIVFKLFGNIFIFRSPSALQQINRLCDTTLTRNAAGSHQVIRVGQNVFCKPGYATDQTPLHSEKVGEVRDKI